jgi:DNA-binding MurR/RpiR family transcriptional regulator
VFIDLSPLAVPMLNTIRALMPDLTKAEQRVARLLLQDPSRLLRASIGELAESWAVSEPTLVRFARAVGCSGFQELRLKVATELGERSAQPGSVVALHVDDSGATLIEKVFAHAASALTRVRAELDAEQIDIAIKCIEQAGRLILFCHESTVHIAHEVAHRFLQLDLPMMVFGESVAQAQMASQTRAGDVVLMFSLGEGSTQWRRHVETIQGRGARVLAVTRTGSALSAAVPEHISLNVPGDADGFLPELASIISLLLMEVIALGVALRKAKSLSKKIRGQTAKQARSRSIKAGR